REGGDGSNRSLEWENNNLPRELAAVCAQLDCPEKEADASSASEYGGPSISPPLVTRRSLEWENNNLPRELAAMCAQLDCPDKEMGGGDGSNRSLEWENNNLPRELAAVCAQLDCPEKEADASSASEYGFPDLALIADSLILYILNQLFCTDFGTPKNPRITSLDNSAFATTFFVITLFFSSMLNAGIRAISCMIYKSQQIHAFLVYKTYSRGCIPLPV
ncbi:hypothetical protein Tco_0746773, partial [Tanacetum coccineum]